MWDDERFNVYLGVNPRPRVGAKGNKCIERARCQVADFDKLTATTPLERVEEVKAIISQASLPDATAIMHTGRGCHVYWMLTNDVIDLNAWSDRQLDLATVLQSDESICNPERILRLAGTTNYKNAPVPCEIMEFATANAYELCDLDEPLAMRLPPAAPAMPDEGELVEKHVKLKAKERNDTSVINAFNESADLRQILRSNGYLVAGSRFRRAGKESGSFSGTIIECRDGRTRSFHFSTEDKLYSSRFTSKSKNHLGIADAFDAFCVLVHNGDVRSAVRDAAFLLNIPLPKQKSDDQVIREVLASEQAEGFAKAFLDYQDSASKGTLRTLLAGILGGFTSNPMQVDRFIERAARGAL